MTLTGSPTDPVPEVHGAQGVAMTFLFDGPLLKESVTVDASRLHVLDVGNHSLILEPVRDFRADERAEVQVLFADGELRRAVFAVVAHPSEVDTRIDVTRRAPSPDAACQARLEAQRADYGAQSPIAFRLSGVLSPEGIAVRTFKRSADTSDGFTSKGGSAFLGDSWALLDVSILNPSGQPWAPRGAVLTSRGGQAIGVRRVRAVKEVIAPGSSGRVLVETDVPSPSAGVDFTLHVRGEDGRTALVSNVRLPPRAKEAGP